MKLEMRALAALNEISAQCCGRQVSADGPDKTFWKGKTVTTALSGGRDSVCLLFVLLDLLPEAGAKVQAVHVNHSIRQNAMRDQHFCETLCREKNVPLTVRTVNVPLYAAQQGLSLEDAARDLRYEALESVPADFTATAHYQMDQAETVLLHLLRGSGLGGLCGMKLLSFRENMVLIRPLLMASAEELKEYAARKQLSYVHDETNDDDSYTRNRIRHELIPILQQYNPSVVETICRMASMLSTDEEYLSKEAGKAFPQTMKASYLLSLEPAIAGRVVRKWLEQAGLTKDVSQRHTQAVLDLAAGNSGKQCVLARGLTVEKSYDILQIHNTAEEYPSGQVSDGTFAGIDLSAFYVEPGFSKDARIMPEDSSEKWLMAQKDGPVPVWRTRQSGDYLYIRKSADGPDSPLGRKTIKSCFSDAKIPRAMRDKIPLLCQGSHVLWIFGQRVCESAKLRCAKLRCAKLPCAKLCTDGCSETSQTLIHAGRRLHAQ